jgi:hypothetical protein
VRHNLSPGSLLVASRLTAILALASCALCHACGACWLPYTLGSFGSGPGWVWLRPGSIACRAPAPSDSDSARPAPDQPLPGLIAQSCVRLRPGSAACGACWLPLRPTRVRPAWLRINHVLACWLKRGSSSGLDQRWCFCAPVSSDSDTARPAPDILVLA